MEKFLSLPEERQNVLINAALQCFGTNGYKKASIGDIAKAAGISKAMVFHYFGTKKALYLFLIRYCGSIMEREIRAKFNNAETDFFKRIKMSASIQISVMKSHPATPKFLTTMYFESNEEVKDDARSILAAGEAFRNGIAFDGTDTSKFKDGIDLGLVMRMLYWLADGFANQLSNQIDHNLDDLFHEFEECLDLLRDSFYR